MKQLFNIIIMGVFLLKGAGAYAGDVYNFYFQKAPGVKTVIQGGEKGQIVKTVEDGTETVVEEAAEVLPVMESMDPDDIVEPEQDDEDIMDEENAVHVRANANVGRGKVSPGDRKRRWSVSLGVGAITGADLPEVSGLGNYSSNHGTYVVGLNFRMSKYFDIDTAIQMPSNDSTNEVGDSIGPGPEMSFGLGITPLHLRLFGREILYVGAIGGFMTRVKYTSVVNSCSYSGNFCSNSGEAETGTTTYLGPRIGVRLSEAFQIEASHKVDLEDNNYGQTALTLAYRW